MLIIKPKQNFQKHAAMWYLHRINGKKKSALTSFLFWLVCGYHGLIVTNLFIYFVLFV